MSLDVDENLKRLYIGQNDGQVLIFSLDNFSKKTVSKHSSNYFT